MKEKNQQNKQNQKFAKGFTLLELLVVVVIIGILAAIALPQYKRAVLKSTLSTLKETVNAVNAATFRYYYANDKFPENFLDLDIELPPGEYSENKKFYVGSNGIKCYIGSGELSCNKDNLRYGILIFTYRTAWQNKRLCDVLFESDPTTLRHKVCADDTHNTLDTCSENGWCRYYYK